MTDVAVLSDRMEAENLALVSRFIAKDPFLNHLVLQIGGAASVAKEIAFKANEVFAAVDRPSSFIGDSVGDSVVELRKILCAAGRPDEYTRAAENARRSAMLLFGRVALHQGQGDMNAWFDPDADAVMLGHPVADPLSDAAILDRRDRKYIAEALAQIGSPRALTLLIEKIAEGDDEAANQLRLIFISNFTVENVKALANIKREFFEDFGIGLLLDKLREHRPELFSKT